MTSLKRLLFCATDKEIFDAYFSSPQHFNEATLLDTGAERGIFYSVHEDRETLADALSSQIFSYADLRKIESHFEKAGRADRRTAVSLDVSIDQAELKNATQEIIAKALGDETITANAVGQDGYAINVAYTELDFGATRFRQRREREANISVSNESGKTILRLPATVKARGIADELVNIVEKNRKDKIPREDIDLSSFSDHDMRTRFFTMLISTLPDSQPNNVLRVRVERLDQASGAALEDEDEKRKQKKRKCSAW